ncbi:MAG: hypothetical protein KAR38_06415 [Calditrichia bacterium]|nr:hypothetical protein [Calditrichia bacterium]
MKRALLTYSGIYNFFWPLAITNVLMGVTGTIVNAGLTRHADKITALAAFSIAYVVAVFLNSPVYSAQQTAIVLVKGKMSFKRVHIFLLMQGVLVLLLQLLIIFSPAGRWLFLDFIGVSETTTRLALYSMIIWLPFAVIISWRGLLQAVLIQYKKTFFISVATGIRILFMVAFLIICPFFLKIHGALISALAITFSIFMEVVIVFIYARPIIKALPDETGTKLSLKEFVKFSTPLSLSMLLWTAAGFLLNTIVAHSADSEAALAVMAIAYNSFGWFVSAPAKVLLQCTLILVKDKYSQKKIKKFAVYLMSLLTVAMIIIVLPGIFEFFFSYLFIIEENLHSYLKNAMYIVVFYPLAIGIRNYIQGNLVRNKFTATVSYASIGRLLVLILIAFITKYYPLKYGATYGLIILIGSIYIENIILWIYSKRKIG